MGEGGGARQVGGLGETGGVGERSEGGSLGMCSTPTQYRMTAPHSSQLLAWEWSMLGAPDHICWFLCRPRPR